MALPDYLQEAGKDFAKQLTAQTAVPIDTGQFTGRQFVAGEDPLQTQAINLATQGIGSFQPFLQQAQNVLQTQAGLAGTGAGTGAGSIAAFTSPFQQQVIDETLRQFDRSRATGLQQIADDAFTSGAFGGGRQGALEGQFLADTALGRAGLEAQLRAQGFADAVARRQQDFANQSGIASGLLGLSNFQRQNLAGDVANLGQLGAFRQGLTQSQLAADQQAAQTAAFEPFTRLDRFGAGITGLAGGVGGPQFQAPATPSPFSTALSTALGIGGLFGKFR
tara:strand:- start:1651 stop:2484 length:834 start_codon:yes stop_codon:yes gene_type:complete